MTIHQEIYDGPPRWYTPTATTKRLVTIHNTSNPNLASARQEIAYSKTRPRDNAASSQYYADRVEVLQSLDTRLVAWHAGSTTGNNAGIAWEFTGQNGSTREWWMANVEWDMVASYMAADCVEYAIPATLLTPAQARGGSRGFITHDIARLAWGGTTHTDPGPNFPMDHLLRLVSDRINGTENDVAKYWFAGQQPTRWFGDAMSKRLVTPTEEGDLRWLANHEHRFELLSDRPDPGGMGPDVATVTAPAPVNVDVVALAAELIRQVRGGTAS